jgi:steroid 5-alpha reductase family enzyme
MTAIPLLAVLLGCALAISSIGFVRTVWFISIGYAFSIVVFVPVTLLGANAAPGWISWAQLLALLVWGLRLGIYLTARERKAAYRAAVSDQTDRSQALPVVVRMLIWLSVSALYVCMFSPAVFLAYAGATLSADALLGTGVAVTVMALGLALESLADRQKARLKACDPNTFAHTGLYGWVRYPNYLGEMLFWIGNFLAGLFAYNAWWHWVLAAVGCICIQLIMLGSTKRLELKQNERYGADPAYAEYVRSVPVLLPGVPLYSLRRVWLTLG